MHLYIIYIIKLFSACLCTTYIVVVRFESLTISRLTLSLSWLFVVVVVAAAVGITGHDCWLSIEWKSYVL